MVSTVSPAATVIAVPPSQLQLAFAAGLDVTDPVASDAVGRALWDAMVLPPATPLEWDGAAACAVCGPSGPLSTGLTGAACAGASGWLLAANGLSLNRDVSALQAPTPTLSSASAHARGQDRARNISKTQDIA